MTNTHTQFRLRGRIPSSIAVLLLLVAASAQAQNAAPQPAFDGKSWWEHVKVLAADDMEGRNTGSEGLRKASNYVVEQLKEMGAEPAGSDGFYQSIKFRERRLDEGNSSLALIREGKDVPLVLGDDAVISTRIDLAPEVNAPLVFVGYGLKVPELKHDDFAGLDLSGKVVVYLTGAPAGMPTELASHYQSASERWKALREAGAIGYITIQNPAAVEVPWPRIKKNRLQPSMGLADQSLNETAGAKFAALFNMDRADKLFQGAKHGLAEIATLGKKRRPLPKFPLAVSLKARTKLVYREVESSNIVAKVTGSDETLKNEYVVLSAHIDHLGIGEPVKGDRIFNGAMDNSSGSAVLLDVAAWFKRNPDKLKRSLLFLWCTGEEKGLLGSKYFAAHPTVPIQSIVANINTDMFQPIVPLKILTVYGLKESDLGDDAKRVAERWNIKVQADPEPLRNLFIRSDQYSFIRRGIPAIAMKVGFTPGSPEAQVDKEWREQRYHAPSDDLNQKIDLQAAARYEDVYRSIIAEVAGSTERPKWKPDSFFRRFAAAEVASEQAGDR